MAWNDHPQSARGYVYFLQPDIVFKRRVNLASAVYPVFEIPYDGSGTGAYSDIEIGMTVLIGTTDGGYDLGRTYVRAAPTSSVIPIGFSSRGARPGEVTLTDNAYITVVDTYEVWRKPQRLDNASGTIYKDYDLPYSTPPFPIMHVGDLGGLGRIGFTSGGVLTVDAFDWGGSTLVAAADTWSSRTWDMADGTITSGTTTSQAPDATFPAGKRWVTLTGVTSAGATMRRRYLVVALDPASPAIIRANNIKLRRTAEGQTLTCDLKERLDPAAYLPGTVVMLLMRETRGSTVTYTQRFAGWLDVETSFAQASMVVTDKGTTIQAVDVAGKLAQIKALAAVFENEATQASWLHMVGCNPERMMHRLLAFESTALAVTDWALTGLSGSAAYPVMSWAVTGGNMYGVCDALARAMGYRLTCNSKGKLQLKADPLRQDSGSRTATVQRAITEADWKRINWATRARPTTGSLKAQNAVISSGYASTLRDGGLAPFPDVYSIAPGEVAGQGMGESSNPREIVGSQTESNKRVGHDYARLCGDPAYQMELGHGVDADIEPADMTWITVTAAQGHAGYRGPTLTAQKMLPLTVDISVNAVNGVSTQVLTAEKETYGDPGERDPQPATSTAGYSTGAEYPVPGNTVTRSASGLGLVADLALFCTNNKVHLMSSMLELLSGGTPEVESISLTLTGTLGAFVVRADSPNYVDGTGAVNGYIATTSQVRTIDDIFNAQILGTAYSYAAGAVVQPHQVHMQAERGNPDWVLVVTYIDTGGVDAYRTTTGGAAWSTESSLPSFYDSLLPQNAGVWKPGLYMAPDGAGTALVSALAATGTAPGGDFWQTDDYGATWTKIVTAGFEPGDWLACCIVKPLTRTDVIYHGFVFNDSGTGYGYYYRVIGTTAVDITPTYSGGDYGVPFFSYAQRVLSVSDNNPAAVALIGYDRASGKYGVFQTFNALDSSPTWNVVVTPTTGVNYRGVYCVGDGTLLFLFGLSGAFAIARYEGSAWAVYETTISGAGTIVGICGG